MKKFCLFAFVFLFFCFSSPVSAQGFDTDIAGYGFTTGIAVEELVANQTGQVSNHNIKVDVPQGAFSSAVVFEILQGQNSFFQTDAPTGRIIITNFAFRIRSRETDKLVGEFKRPVLVTVILPDDVENVEFWEVELTRPPQIVKSPKTPEIDGKTLMFQASGATKGWIITTSTGDLEKSETEISSNTSVAQTTADPKNLILPVLGIVALGAVVIFLTRH